MMMMMPCFDHPSISPLNGGDGDNDDGFTYLPTILLLIRCHLLLPLVSVVVVLLLLLLLVMSQTATHSRSILSWQDSDDPEKKNATNFVPRATFGDEINTNSKTDIVTRRSDDYYYYYYYYFRTMLSNHGATVAVGWLEVVVVHYHVRGHQVWVVC